ncbi:hypothetical protein [Streptomyces ossamyceticus]|uniref:hypothetical protein n=1 Tax=Streptomyces ossamyceticus TaxID=249581 RepID=UPI00341784E4
MTDQVRPFRLHLPHQVLDGWEEPDGLAVAVDDPEYGLTSAAPTLADLSRGYGGGHIEWPATCPTHYQHEGGHRT